jgi:hypothetical protein
MTNILLGKAIHYVLAQYDLGEGRKTSKPGRHVPGIIVQDWGSSINAVIFIDGTNDFWDGKPAASPGQEKLTLWRTSITRDEDTRKPGSWHLEDDTIQTE